jgi:phasin
VLEVTALRIVNAECDGKEAKMADQQFNDFVPPEIRKFAEQSVQQAQKAFDDLMTATQRAVSTFEGHANSAQSTAVELQRKVVGYSERNVRASLEFAQKLVQAKGAEDVLKLHSDYVKTQIQALAEQAQDIAQQAAKAAKPPGNGS